MKTKFKRVIFIYEKSNENLVSEIDISLIPIVELKKIITSYDDDPHLIMSYTLTTEQVNKINTHIQNNVKVDSRHFIYQIDSYRID